MSRRNTSTSQFFRLQHALLEGGAKSLVCGCSCAIVIHEAFTSQPPPLRTAMVPCWIDRPEGVARKRPPGMTGVGGLTMTHDASQRFASTRRGRPLRLLRRRLPPMQQGNRLLSVSPHPRNHLGERRRLRRVGTRRRTDAQTGHSAVARPTVGRDVAKWRSCICGTVAQDAGTQVAWCFARSAAFRLGGGACLPCVLDRSKTLAAQSDGRVTAPVS